MPIFNRFWNKKLGDEGEQIAATYLKKKGYKILATNFATEFGEIDIVTRKGRILVFVEVKTRYDNAAGYPEDAVDDRKKAKIASVGEVFRRKGKIEDYPWQIDVIAVENIDDKLVVTRHLEDIY